jgi:hypothetical protein
MDSVTIVKKMKELEKFKEDLSKSENPYSLIIMLQLKSCNGDTAKEMVIMDSWKSIAFNIIDSIKKLFNVEK